MDALACAVKRRRAMKSDEAFFFSFTEMEKE